ncbi:MAG: extracellular solute-binding protein [Firmicutes bacterium]|nr:extracellular solute-binding protein [Bacillota bacterium]
MKKAVGRIVSLFVALVIVFSLAACGKGHTGKPSGANDAAHQEAVIKLSLWHLSNSDSDTNKIVKENAIKTFQEQNQNVELEVDTVENESYKTKIKTAIAANEAPDVFFVWGAGFAKPFVDAGKVLPIDEYLKDGTKDKLLPGTLANFTYDGKVYGLPACMWIAVLYCNEELFNGHNVKIPDTFDELLTAVKAFRANGIDPITVGEKDRWPGMFYQNIFAIRTAGVELSNKALNKEASFDDPRFVESAVKLKELVDAEAFEEGILGLSNDEAQANFIQGKIPMFYMGNWAASQMEAESSKVKGKVVVRNFPALAGAQGDAKGALGGAIDGYMVSAETKHKEEAVALQKHMCESIDTGAYQAGNALPAWKAEVDESKLSPLAVEIANVAKDSTGFVLAWDTFLDPAAADVHKNLVQEIFAGVKTPEEFVKEMQALNKE